ncbi:probable WRKY transcription factor 70 [Rhodamnia argentea]|uniref:Probable WRKY transcription factor 70 n=1 Tax=Rhodamnia argentea TaxID=178133 RepID=A0ABM3GSK4_9MYRT|nr:probable WRKY transcription factor 70 [Rhodamnia argentea]
MERCAWPKNLSSSRKHAIKELLHGQNPTKKIRHLFDAHSQTGNNTAQPLIAEDLIVNVLRSFSNTLSLSSSAAESASYEVLQVPTNACVRSEVSEEVSEESIKPPPVPTNACVGSEVSEGSESIHTPVPRRNSDTWTRLDLNLIDDGSYFRCAHRFVQGCLAVKHVQKIEDDATLYMVTYRGPHTCLVNSSIPLSFNTSLIAEQDDDDGDSIFINFQSSSSDYNPVFKSVGDIKSWS